MANENKNINELVSDPDDTVAEIDAVTLPQDLANVHRMAPAESDEQTFDASQDAARASDDLATLRRELRKRSDTIERLQFDMEQLRAKWLGLEAELEAREEVSSNLTKELSKTQNEISVARRRLAERDESIESLETAVREGKERNEELEQRLREAESASAELASGAEIDALRKSVTDFEGLVASQNAALAELRAQQERTEAYADSLRRQYADLYAEIEEARSDRERLKESLAGAEAQVETLTAERDTAKAAAETAEQRLAEIQDEHERELRQLRFELGEAKETVAEHATLSEQLAAELVDTHGTRQELEQTLNATSVRNQNRIEELEDQVALLESTISAYEDELEAKADAINCLLEELSGNEYDADPIGEIEHAIHDLDDRMSDRMNDRMGDGMSDRKGERHAPPGDRVARLLVGRIDKQDLRFPLFKNRLTIGRTRQNDIQLKADYVSRRHAVLVTEGDRTRVIDWGSKNGVYVNSKRVKEHFLANGDILAIGTAKFRYEERIKRDN